MKKLLIAANILTLVLLYTGSFTNKPLQEKKQEGPVICSNTICTDYTQNPITGISINTAKGMASIYRQNQWKTLNLNQNFLDSRSVWFSLDKMKSFIAEIEAQSCEASCTPLKLGIRIYEGAYPNFENMGNIKLNTDYRDVKDEYSRHMTMFMVPTYYDQARNVQVDFDPRNKGNNKCAPTPLKDLLGRTDPKLISESSVAIARNGKLKVVETEPVPGSGNKLLGATPAPGGPARLNLILSAIENQTFYSEKKKPGIQTASASIVNHGNTIPPDSETGTAF